MNNFTPTVAPSRSVRRSRQAVHRASCLPGRRADGVHGHPDGSTRCGGDPDTQLRQDWRAAVDADSFKHRCSTLHRAGRATPSISRRARMITHGGR
jgi:hypothetical protein